MPEWLHSILGNVTGGELALVGVLFLSIMLFTWAPRIGETLGGWLDSDDDGT